MKKVEADAEDEMKAEYRFDYSTARPNRFAEHMGADSIAVVLDPDVVACGLLGGGRHLAILDVCQATPTITS